MNVGLTNYNNEFVHAETNAQTSDYSKLQEDLIQSNCWDILFYQFKLKNLFTTNLMEQMEQNQILIKLKF